MDTNRSPGGFYYEIVHPLSEFIHFRKSYKSMWNSLLTDLNILTTQHKSRLTFPIHVRQRLTTMLDGEDQETYRINTETQHLKSIGRPHEIRLFVNISDSIRRSANSQFRFIIVLDCNNKEKVVAVHRDDSDYNRLRDPNNKKTPLSFREFMNDALGISPTKRFSDYLKG